MKTGQFEGGIAHRATGVALVRDEPTQCEPATFHRDELEPGGLGKQEWLQAWNVAA